MIVPLVLISLIPVNASVIAVSPACASVAQELEYARMPNGPELELCLETGSKQELQLVIKKAVGTLPDDQLLRLIGSVPEDQWTNWLVVSFFSQFRHDLVRLALAQQQQSLSNLSTENQRIFIQVSLLAENYDGYFMLLNSDALSVESVTGLMDLILQQPGEVFAETRGRFPELMDAASGEARNRWVGAMLLAGYPDVLQYFLLDLSDSDKQAIEELYFAVLYNEKLSGNAGLIMSGMLSDAGFDLVYSVCKHVREKQVAQDKMSRWGRETYLLAMEQCP